MQNYNSKFKSDLKTRCYQFSLQLVGFIDTLAHTQSSRIIANQLIRAGTSVGANLVEATASNSRLEFKKFHEIALKSANETKYWLGILHDSGKADKNKVTTLLNEVSEIANMIASGILRLKGKK